MLQVAAASEAQMSYAKTLPQHFVTDPLHLLLEETETEGTRPVIFAGFGVQDVNMGNTDGDTDVVLIAEAAGNWTTRPCSTKILRVPAVGSPPTEFDGSGDVIHHGYSRLVTPSRMVLDHWAARYTTLILSLIHI